MSQYLCFGIAKQIVVKKKGWWQEFSEEEIKQDFFRTVDEQLYNVTCDDEYVYFDLKEQLLVKHGINIIKEQYEKYIKHENNKEIIKELEDIEKKDDQEKLEIINEKSFRYLQNFKLGWYGLCAKCFFELDTASYITELIVYHCTFKTFMEEYNEFFKYTRNLLINSTSNPLRTALAVAL